MVFTRKQKTLDWSDAGAITRELGKVREHLPDAEAAAVAAAVALDAHLERREVVGLGVTVARRQALVAGADMSAIRDPSDPAAFILVSQAASDEAAATLRQRERLWDETSAAEGKLRITLTSANERRGNLKMAIRSYEARIEQLKTEANPPPPRRERTVPNWQPAAPKGA